MIIASIAEATVERVVQRIDQARKAGADAAEVRVDYLETREIEPILARKTLPVIVTARPVWEGGRWTGSEDDRIALLREACRAGAEYVDVEFKAYKDFDRGRASLILSWHDFEATPENLDAIARKMAGLEPAMIKIAVQARGIADAMRCVAVQKTLPLPGTVIAMGEFGEALRILYRRYGGVVTYASIGDETAPGQLTVAELVQQYRAKTIDDETQVYAVLGDPVAQSRSPRVFNRVFNELGLNARYVKIRVDDSSRLRDVMAAFELRGASVTIPHKEAALVASDAPDEIAKGVGAANTLVAGGKATNTDAPAAVEAIREAAKRKWSHGMYGMRALVLGAGGSARAIAWGLRAEGARVILANRTYDRAKALADALRCEVVGWERLIEARAQVVANATSVGMNEDRSPYPAELWKKDMVAFDAVYTPRDTRFLRDARTAGAETADGVEMFLRQANLQLKEWVGRTMPTEVYKELAKTL